MWLVTRQQDLDKIDVFELVLGRCIKELDQVPACHVTHLRLVVVPHEHGQVFGRDEAFVTSVEPLEDGVGLEAVQTAQVLPCKFDYLFLFADVRQ